MLPNVIALAASLTSDSAPRLSRVLVIGKEVVGFSFVDKLSRISIHVESDSASIAEAESHSIPRGVITVAKLMKSLDKSYALSFAKDGRIMFRSESGNFSIVTEPTNADQCIDFQWPENPNIVDRFTTPECLSGHLKTLAPMVETDNIQSSVSILPGVDKLSAWSSSYVAYLKGGYQSEIEVQFLSVAIKAIAQLGTPNEGVVVEVNNRNHAVLTFHRDGWTARLSYPQASTEQLLGSKIGALLDKTSPLGKVTVEADAVIASIERCQLTEEDTILTINPEEQRIEISSEGEMLRVNETIECLVDVEMSKVKLRLNPGLLLDLLRVSTQGLKSVVLDLFLDSMDDPNKLMTGRGFLMLKATK